MSPEAILSHTELVALVLELRAEIATLRAKIVALPAENEVLRAENTALRAENEALRAEIVLLREELSKKNDPPSFVRKNRPKVEPKKRKKRDKGYFRCKSAEPDETLEHAVDVCPHCGNALVGGWCESSRDSMVYPEVKIRLVRHVSIARRCGACGTISVGRPDAQEHGLVGRHLLNARGIAMVAHLHTIGRVPLRFIKLLLEEASGKLCLGSLTGMLHATAEAGAADYARLRDDIRGSPAVHQDETGWRENGRNGYIWVSCTELTRYFEHHASRSGDIPLEILGDKFSGVVVCDGYGGYNKVMCQKQRCWTHILRHGHEIKEKYPGTPDVHAWVDGLKAIYLNARELMSRPQYARYTEQWRQKKRKDLDRLLQRHAALMESSSCKKAANLAVFLQKHSHELFVFVEYPEVASQNNLAERALRPLVIARKVCGGTRTKEGSKTKMVLMSLLHTAKARGMNAANALEQMLLGTPMFTNPQLA